MWLARFPDLTKELSLTTWEELRPYAHMPPATIADAFRMTITELAEGDPQLKMSIIHAHQLAQMVSELAKANTETVSPPRASPGRSVRSDQTESELTRGTAELAIYSSIKSDIKLVMEYGEGKPAHVSDAMDYITEVMKLFVGMDGYTQLKDMVHWMRDTPGLSLQEMLSSHNLPDKLLVHFAKQLYAGLTARYKRDVVHKCRYVEQEQAAEGMYEHGITMAFVLIRASLELGELHIARKRLLYLDGSTRKPGRMKARSNWPGRIQ